MPLPSSARKASSTTTPCPVLDWKKLWYCSGISPACTARPACAALSNNMVHATARMVLSACQAWRNTCSATAPASSIITPE
jgi:hypothetical protein